MYSSLNPSAPEFHPSTLTTTTVHLNPPPQTHRYLHHYQPHFRPLNPFLPHNPPNYYYLTTYTSHDNTTVLPPSSPPPETMDPTRTRGCNILQKRRGSVRDTPRRRSRKQLSRDGTGVGSRVRDRRRGLGNNKDARVRNKGEVVQLKPDAGCTTVMIRNIPARYTRDLLMKFLDTHCKARNTEASKSAEKFTSAYDFLYLPVDFQTNANKGFAFVNFTDPRAAWRFFETSNDQSWDLFCSSKIRQIVRAKLQGKENLVKHFRGATFRCESDDYLPVYFSPARDGSAGEKVELTVVGNRVW